MEKDERFRHIWRDPRFRPIPKHERKVKIDSRFNAMFQDKSFLVKYTMDKRGRPMHHTTAEDMKKYYDLGSSDEDSDDSDMGRAGDRHEAVLEEKEVGKQKVSEISRVDLQKTGSPDLQVKSIKMPKTKPGSIEETDSEESDDASSIGSDRVHDSDDIHRQSGFETTSSETTGSEDESDEEVLDHKWGELDKDAPEATEITRRLAVCNMDWDRIKAHDLFLLFNSFKPAEGTVHSVKIYPSEYGKKRMQEEVVKGPAELVEMPQTGKDTNDEAETSEGTRYHIEKLRQYQINRLKYYYAIVECDSPETANRLYQEMDGMEYESSASQLDLRFVPDDTMFEEEPTVVANGMSSVEEYRPNLFTTSALQQAQVQLTWDETDPNRTRAMHEAFEKGDDNMDDLKMYLASSSSEDEPSQEEKGAVTEGGDEKDSITKYRALLLQATADDGKKESDVEMEITWEPGLRDITTEILKKREEPKDLTPWQEYLKKKKEKRKKKEKNKQEAVSVSNVATDADQQAFSDDELPEKIDRNEPFFQDLALPQDLSKVRKRKKAKYTKELGEEDLAARGELELLLVDEHETDRRHFNLKKLVLEGPPSKRKRRSSKVEAVLEDAFEINLQDPRFRALYTSPLYHLDPSDPHFKNTKSMEAIRQERQRLRDQEQGSTDSIPGRHQVPQQWVGNQSLSHLVKAVKAKTNHQQKVQRKRLKVK